MRSRKLRALTMLTPALIAGAAIAGDATLATNTVGGTTRLALVGGARLFGDLNDPNSEASRALVWKVAWKHDKGERHTIESRRRTMARSIYIASPEGHTGKSTIA